MASSRRHDWQAAGQDSGAKRPSGLFSKIGAVSGRANGGSHLLQRCPKIRVFIRVCSLLLASACAHATEAKVWFPAIAPASHRALGLTSVRTQEEREPARLSCRTMNAGQDGPATRDRAIQGGWSLIVPADSANRLARMGHRHARSAARREAHIPENGKDGYIVIAMLMRLKKI